jgi:hypothetical protein
MVGDAKMCSSCRLASVIQNCPLQRCSCAVYSSRRKGFCNVAAVQSIHHDARGSVWSTKDLDARGSVWSTKDFDATNQGIPVDVNLVQKICTWLPTHLENRMWRQCTLSCTWMSLPHSHQPLADVMYLAHSHQTLADVIHLVASLTPNIADAIHLVASLIPSISRCHPPGCLTHTKH